MRKQVHHAGESRQAGAPAVAPIVRPELESDPKRLARIAGLSEHRDYRLADDEREVALDAVAQALDAMPMRVAARTEIDPDVAAFDLDRERAHVVRPRIERAAAMQVEPRVMPMAGEDAILHGAAIEGKAHVRASIVHGEDPLGRVEQRDYMAVQIDGHAASLRQVGERCGANESAIGGFDRLRIHRCGLLGSRIIGKVLALQTKSSFNLTNNSWPVPS